MPTENIWLWLSSVLCIVLGAWYCLGKIRASQVSGYSFYVTAGILQGAPFFIGAIWLFFDPNVTIGWFFLVYISSRLGVLWTGLQEQKAQKLDPARWETWRAQRAQFSPLNRLFL